MRDHAESLNPPHQPETYWAVWSDATIHAIHLRVLAHVKHLTEGWPAQDPRGKETPSSETNL